MKIRSAFHGEAENIGRNQRRPRRPSRPVTETSPLSTLIHITQVGGPPRVENGVYFVRFSVSSTAVLPHSISMMSPRVYCRALNPRYTGMPPQDVISATMLNPSVSIAPGGMTTFEVAFYNFHPQHCLSYGASMSFLVDGISNPADSLPDVRIQIPTRS
ncbi:MAG: hypothetical protein IPJ69_08695 [Deltaproteobacteria bacterium]|nr:MAG: hypothetical protein IPJ69_08695 [Deltaproteobacteria bacterium]